MADWGPIEADPRFPSGKWIGFYTYSKSTDRGDMELHLTFRAGRFHGEGRDPIGLFEIEGVYTLDDGACQFRKTYPGRHTVNYTGFNEGRGIWGTWTLEHLTGGFHIWPLAMGDPTRPELEAEAPMEYEEVEEGELLPVGVG